MKLDVDRLHRETLNPPPFGRHTGETVRWCAEVMGLIGLERELIHVEVPYHKQADYYMRQVLLPMLQDGGYEIKEVHMGRYFICDKSRIEFLCLYNPNGKMLAHIERRERYVVRSDYWPPTPEQLRFEAKMRQQHREQREQEAWQAEWERGRKERSQLAAHFSDSGYFDRIMCNGRE